MTFKPYRNLKVARCHADGHPLWFDPNDHVFVCPRCRKRYPMDVVIKSKGRTVEEFVINRF